MVQERNKLGEALVAAAVSAMFVSFIGGCFYPIFGRLWNSAEQMTGRQISNDLSIWVLLEFGLMTAIIALPVVLVLTLAVGIPLFRLLNRRKHIGVATHVLGGGIISVIGAIVIATLHYLFDFLSVSDLPFALLLTVIAGPVAGLVVGLVMRHPRGGLV